MMREQISIQHRSSLHRVNSRLPAHVSPLHLHQHRFFRLHSYTTYTGTWGVVTGANDVSSCSGPVLLSSLCNNKGKITREDFRYRTAPLCFPSLLSHGARPPTPPLPAPSSPSVCCSSKMAATLHHLLALPFPTGAPVKPQRPLESFSLFGKAPFPCFFSIYY